LIAEPTTDERAETQTLLDKIHRKNIYLALRLRGFPKLHMTLRYYAGVDREFREDLCLKVAQWLAERGRPRPLVRNLPAHEGGSMKRDLDGKWVTSTNGEWYDSTPCDTPEDAIAEAMSDLDEDRHVQSVGQIKLPDYTTGHARDIIENMECRAGDTAHEDCNVSIGSVSKDALNELDNAISETINGWMHKHGLGFTHWEVVNVKQVMLGKIVSKEPPNA